MAEGNNIKLDIDRAKLEEALKAACNWLTEIAQVRTENLTIENNSRKLAHRNWKGSIRGEYRASNEKWDFFCPIWHTGQAIKALVLAGGVLNDDRLLEAAKLGAEFIGRERIIDGNDENYGLIFAYEDNGNAVNTSAILECLDGLFYLGEHAGDEACKDWAIVAARWVALNAYIENEGLYRDEFSSERSRFELPVWWSRDILKWPGRPLIDDGILLKAYHYTGDEKYRKVFYETADRLLKEEEPAGNWIRFIPCNMNTGSIHPRQGYWWGRPMLMAYSDSGDERYLKCAERVGQWYIDAQRADGGLMRGTYRDFKTDSFGHCTSGIACAAILWLELWEATGDEKWLKPIEKAVWFCMKMQVVNPKDPNMKGVIIEKVLPPDGTDCSPYYIRDLGTIFFIQAAARILKYI